MTPSGTVVVVGSANMDYIIRVDKAPSPGETVLARDMRKIPGGKGANQAVAAARLGAHVTFVGCLGTDDDGAAMRAAMIADGIDLSHTTAVTDAATGLAVITVTPDGENAITVIPGANAAVGSEAGRTALEQAAADRGGVLVVQAEIPASTIAAAVADADALGVRVVLNLAPYSPLDAATLAVADPLVVNETEASQIVGFSVDSSAALDAALDDLAHRARSVIITVGARGAHWRAGTGDSAAGGHVPAKRVDEVVDTTGAGDAFVGALAAQLSAGAGISEAMELAVQVSALSITKAGAQASYPRAADLLA